MTRKLAELLDLEGEIIARGDAIKIEAEEKGWDDDRRDGLFKARDELVEVRKELGAAQEIETAVDGFRAAGEERDKFRSGTRVPLYNGNKAGGVDEPGIEVPTLGDLFVRSEAYKAWLKQYPDGGPAVGITDNSMPEHATTLRHLMGMRTSTEKLTGQLLTPDKYRALMTSSSTSGGSFMRPDWLGLLEPGLLRPLYVRQLVSTIPVTTDNIQYVRETGRVHGAAFTAEATALTGSSGLKPEGGMTWAVVTDYIKTIAEWVPITKRILADQPQLRGFIDQYLYDDIALALEDQIVQGNGIGENLLGIMNTPGVTTQGVVGGYNNFDLVRRARTTIRMAARVIPNAVLVNPEDVETFDVSKASTAGVYFGPGPYGGAGPAPLWGMTLVETEAVPQGKALVGDFRRAVLFDREDTTISVGTANDDFIRNILRVLAEARYGFGVLRPTAFQIVTLA